MRLIQILICIICGGAVIQAAPLSYLKCTPAEGEELNSPEFVLSFDLSDLISEYGDGPWGVCCNGTYSKRKPEQQKSVQLFKGTEEGEVLGRMSDFIDVNDDRFREGAEFSISFPDVEIESGQLYTLRVSLDMYAGRKGIDDYWLEETLLSFFETPLVYTFTGGGKPQKVLQIDACSIQENTALDQLSNVSFKFNYEVSIENGATVVLYDGTNILASSTDITVDVNDPTSIDVAFDNIPLYTGHQYKLVVQPQSICVKDNIEITNALKEVYFTGTGYKYFGVGRVRPSNGSVSIMDEITIPFKFPTSEDKTYGFVNVDNGNKKWFLHIYEGPNTEGEELLVVESNRIGEDNQSLIFRPNYPFKPETEYTLVIPEGDVLAYEIGAPRETYLKDYISERVELHYTTPSVESLPKWEPSPVIPKDGEEVKELTYIILDNPVYEYAGAVYNIVSGNTDVNKGIFYLVTEEGDKEIAKFPVRRTTLTVDSEIGNGELVGTYYIGEINMTLYEGNQYKYVLPENSYIINNGFIGQFIGNPEIAVTLKGATPTADDFGLTANVSDRLHSHADIFSFVTESEIKPGEDAKMVLKDGEESVAEAPVYVAREANGYRAYADFGGKKLDAGKTYDVVLPEGSVYASNGIVNNPEIRSTLTAMPEAPAAPEFVSIKLNIDEYASATYRMVKDQESVLDLKAGDDWKLDTLTLDGEDVTADVAKNGLYTLPALDKDATLDATYAYAHAIDYDYETGVGSIEDLPYSLSKDGSHLIISGLNGGENIAIYTVGGMKIAQLDTVPADMTKASLALPEGQVYIVLINGVSIKWKH